MAHGSRSGLWLRIVIALGALLVLAVGAAYWVGSRPGSFAFAATAAPEDAAQVERGRYLATVGNCATCHTAAGGESYAGGVVFDTPFGAIHSTNITPDPDAGLGRWTLTDFARAMRQGVRADGAHLYPAFPFPSFTNVTDADLVALWSYLRTVPPSKTAAKQNGLGFPFNQRWGMGLWKALFFEPGAYVADASQSAEWNRGAYLVQGLAHCGACHTPRNRLGAEIRDQAFAGGTLQRAGKKGTLRRWSAVNLTPSALGLGHWSRDDITSYLLTGMSARAGTFGPMNEVILNSTRHLTRDDAQAIATYLKSLPAIDPTASGPSAAQVQAGAAVYDVNCGSCHLPTGLGRPGHAPPLRGSAVANATDAASMINVVLHGGKIPPEIKSQPGAWEERMKPFGRTLGNEEVAAVINFVRGSWGNRAPPVSAADVAEHE